MLTGVTPFPSQMSEIRSNSVSKHAQHSFPRFRINPRGVRLFVGQPSPNSRASSTEEKNGKSGSTNSAQVAGSGLGSTPTGTASELVLTIAAERSGTLARASDEIDKHLPSTPET